MTSRLVIRSLALRSLLTLAVVFGGYVLLHGHFASLDAAIARLALEAVGFETSSVGRSDLVVSAGREFSVYAIVTGACSSAAGVLGIAAVSLFLLPGKAWRRCAGGITASLVFVSLNVVRICSILVLGWWLAVADRALAIASLSLPLVVCAAIAGSGRHGVFARIAALLAGGLLAVLLYGVARGLDYSVGMVTYHALAGPVLTFGTLALSLLIVWRGVVGSSAGSVAGDAAAIPPSPLGLPGAVDSRQQHRRGAARPRLS